MFNQGGKNILRLETIRSIPQGLTKEIGDFEKLEVNLVEDFDMEMLKKAIEFEDELFGELGMDEWGIVPQIRHGNVYVLNEPGEDIEIIGLAIMMRDWEDLEEAYLFDFAITEEYQNLGLGTEFLKIISEHLDNQGFEKIGLTVDPKNKPAVHVYKNKLGFETKEVSKHEYGENKERFIMKLDLDKVN